MSMQTRILLIDGDPAAAELTRNSLEPAGFHVHIAHDGHSALELAQSIRPELILTEVALPGLDGMELCKQLRSSGEVNEIPIAFLSCRTSEIDQIAGLSLGADDYLCKPIHSQLLLQRVQALLRRRTTPYRQNSTALHLHGIELNRQYFSSYVDNRSLDLTRTEFEILWALMARPGRPFSRSELLDLARGQNASAMERTIDVHVKSLRQKLCQRGKLLETVHGIGYRFARD
jgi:two-component system phosphate regulon response regulator PhoB